MMATIGAVLMLIIIIEIIYILDLRQQRKRLEDQIWYMRGEKPVDCTPMIGQIGLGESGGVIHCSPE